MTTRIDIYNMALYKLAQSIGVPAITDDSKAADVLNRLWEPMRDLVLTERVWPWAMKAQALALEAEAPLPGWTLRYAYPNDCLTAYAITDAAGISTAGKLVRFASGDWLASAWGSGAFDWDTAHGDQGTSIMTNVRDAFLVYTAKVEDANRYPPQFVNALACRLAAEAAPPLIGEVGLQSKQSLLDEYLVGLTNAGAHAMNEARSDGDYITPSLAARGAVSFPSRGGW